MLASVQLDNFCIELSQPLEDRPDVVLITASDGRRALLGDGQELFTIDEYRQINEANSHG